MVSYKWNFYTFLQILQFQNKPWIGTTLKKKLTQQYDIWFND